MVRAHQRLQGTLVVNVFGVREKEQYDFLSLNEQIPYLKMCVSFYYRQKKLCS